MKNLLRVVAAVVVGLCVAGSAVPWAQAQEKPPADPVSGEWEGTVELPDGPVAFTMKLKVDQTKVSGEVASVQGPMTITEGSWVEAKLAIGFTHPEGGPVVMTGAITDGVLSGSLTFGGGQMVAAWSAKKKAEK